jgi:hypothetical protein
MASTVRAAETRERYQLWLEYVFGRVDEDCDPFEMAWDFKAEACEIGDLYIQTMDRSGTDLIRFTDRQVSIGLQAMFFNNFSDLAFKAMSPSLGVAGLAGVLRGFGPLYRDCLALRTPPVLGHLSETRHNPLEFLTYMLWDVTPLEQLRKEHPVLRDAYFEVLSDTLTLDNDACIESALHGLGHSVYTQPRATEIIDNWLASNPNVRPELLRYAQAARTGRIQ